MRHLDFNRENKVAAPESGWILEAANFYWSAVSQWTSKPRLRK